MKSKSTTGFLKEHDGFHVCHKSCMIFTNHPCGARFAQDAEIRTCNQSSQEGKSSINEEVYSLDCVGEEGIHDELSNKGEVFQQESTVTDSVTVDTPESTQSTCTSNKVMIFSPILDSIKYQDEGSNNLYMRQLDSEDSDDCGKSSCEYEACNMSDVSISDMIFSGPPSGSHSLLDNKADFMFLPKYSCEESSLICDLTEEPMVLPFLENTSDTGDHDGRKSEETRLDADYSSFYLETHQLRSYNQDSQINTLPDPDYECFDLQMYIRNLPDQPSIAFNLLPSSPPNEKQNTKQITLVLDLDETLVHSTLDHCDDADFTFPVFFNMQEHTVYVKQRPHLQTFLERVSEMFEIAVFTASESIYAKQLLDILDRDGKLISRRAYRESCVLSEGIYMKDLTILNVDLAKVVIIDNSPQVFRLQVNNGIPIKSWFDDPSDCALISLLPFLETLVDADDVRPIIARKFSNKE